MKNVPLNRVLKLWRFGVSHSQLVLLGQKDQQNPTRVIFLFKETSKICIPTRFYCEEVRWDEQCQEKDVLLLTKEESYQIVCEHVWFDEDELEFDGENPLLDEKLF